VPRRSNYLQKIVFGLERQVAGKAEVEQSPLLKDRVTGREREVDIVVSGWVGGRRIMIGVEVTASRADVGWVDEMVGKHRNLPTDKLVLFSQGGFTDGAIADAAAAGVETVTLEEPGDADWQKVCGKLSQVLVASVSLVPRSGTAALKTAEGLRPAVEPETEIFMKDGRRVGTFQDLASAFLRGANVLERVHAREDRQDLKRFVATINVPYGLHMRDTADGLHEVLSLTIEGDCEYQEVVVDIASSEYRGAQVAHGSGRLGSQDIALIITEIETEPMRSSIVVYKGENDPGDVVDLASHESEHLSSGHREAPRSELEGGENGGGSSTRGQELTAD